VLIRKNSLQTLIEAPQNDDYIVIGPAIDAAPLCTKRSRSSVTCQSASGAMSANPGSQTGAAQSESRG
jgi:hypothetical protein